MNSKAYSARNVNTIELSSFLQDRDGQDLWVGVDVGKIELHVVLHWAVGDFERPWKVGNPNDLAKLIDHLRRLSVGRRLILGMEPSGTYGDALRQACADAQIIVHRVSPKVAHDYAEVFDGVPSQHDGKDAAVVAELVRTGKSAVWPWAVPSVAQQQIEYWVDRMDAHRRLRQMWSGRLEARLARHWPEVLMQLKLTSPTLLHTLIEHGGPAALAVDPQATAKLHRLGGSGLTAESIDRILAGARHTQGVRQHCWDLQRMRDYATEALAARGQVKIAQKRLLELSADQQPIAALAGAVGNSTAAVLWVYLGDPSNYHCGAAYVKAMGLNLKERSSGMHQGKLKITKRGAGVIRYWMYLAALRLLKKNSPVRPWYLRKKHRDADNAARALVGIMRRLGVALYNVAAHGEAFDARRLFPGSRKIIKGG